MMLSPMNPHSVEPFSALFMAMEATCLLWVLRGPLTIIAQVEASPDWLDPEAGSL